MATHQNKIVVDSKTQLRSAVLFSIIVLELLISRLLVLVGVLSADDNVYSAIIIVLNSVLFFIYLTSRIEDLVVKYILLLSYLARLALNVYMISFPLASDMLGYQTSAINFYYDNDVTLNRHFSMAAVAFGSFYKMIGIQRILLQYLNGTLVVISGCIVYRLLRNYKCNKTYTRFAIGWIQFSYHLFWNSCNVHQEAIIVFCVTCSLAQFVKWFNSGKRNNMIGTYLYGILASAFHAGTVGMLAGYTIAFIFFRPRLKAFRFTARSIFIAVFIVLLFSLLTLYARNVFFAKLLGRSLEGMAEMTSTEKGGSYYRIGRTITNSAQMIVYTPLRALYLFCSPMPWDWRGVSDALAFLGSSMIYGYSFLRMFHSLQKKHPYRVLILILIIGIIVFGIIFGWGTRTAGTALRHRDKSISVCAFALALSGKQVKEVCVSHCVKGNRTIHDS